MSKRLFKIINKYIINTYKYGVNISLVIYYVLSQITQSTQIILQLIIILLLHAISFIYIFIKTKYYTN